MKFTAIVCHFSLREIASSLPSAKYCMSSSNRSVYPRLSAIQPPCPLAQFRMQESVGRGRSPNMKTLYQPGERGAKEEAILELTSSVGLRSEVVSQITNGTAIGIREGPDGVSAGCTVNSKVSCGLLLPRGARG